MSKKKSRYITLRWRGPKATPLTIRLDAIESLSPTIDKGGCKLSYGNGQTATVTMPYDTLRDLLAKHAEFVDLPTDGGHEQNTEGSDRAIYEDGAEGPRFTDPHPDA